MLRIGLFVLIMLSSCSTKLDYKQPGSRFYTPESMGESKAMGLAWNYAQGTKTVVTEVHRESVFSSNVTVNNEGAVDRSRQLGVEGRLGIHEDFDLELSKDLDAPFLFGIKYQAYGSSLKAKEKGFKQAFGLGAGTDKESSDSVFLTEGTETRNYEAEVEILKWNLYSSSGYRINENWLFYLNGYYTKHSLDSEVTAKENQFTAFEKESKLLNYGANIGVHYMPKENLLIQLEIGRQKVEFDERLQLYTTPIGFKFGFVI